MKKSQDYYILASLVALAEVDGQICEKEVEFIKKTGLVLLSPPENDEIETVLKSPPNFFDSFSLIKSPLKKRTLIKLTKELFLIDGSVHKNEKDTYNTLLQVIQNKAIKEKVKKKKVKKKAQSFAKEVTGNNSSFGSFYFIYSSNLFRFLIIVGLSLFLAGVYTKFLGK